MEDSPLNILITNLRLSQRNGTEIVTRDLALGLRRLGHRPIILTQTDGPLTTELRGASIPVATDIAQIGVPVDVIHAHHTHMAAIAIARFPSAPCVFLAHDFVAWSDAPPLLPSVRRYLAVDETVADRLIFEHGLSTDAVRVHLNAVDLERFRPGPELPRKPRRALAFAKNAEHVAALREACAARAIELDVVGQAVGRLISAPEIWLPRYDLVFASALTALEAMACGRAVIVCDGRGLAGFATPARFAQWRSRNFGLRTLIAPVTTVAVLREIDAYDAESAAKVGRRVRQEAGLDAWLAALLDLYRQAIAEHRASPPSEAEAALAMARHLQTWAPRVDERWPWMAERERLIQQRDAVASIARSRNMDGKGERPVEFADDAFLPLDQLFRRWHDCSLAGRIDQALAQARRYLSRAPAAYIEEHLPELRDQLWGLFNAGEVELTSRLCRLLLDCQATISDGSLYYLAAVATHLTPARDSADNAFVLKHYTLALETGFAPSWPLYHRGRLRLEQGDSAGRADLEQARDLGGDAGAEATRFLASPA
jgi:glycosyltransferase involved in cell wall biosynthesis